MSKIEKLIKKALKANPSMTYREITDFVGKKRHTKYNHVFSGNVITKVKKELGLKIGKPVGYKIKIRRKSRVKSLTDRIQNAKNEMLKQIECLEKKINALDTTMEILKD